jgi:hypothetical protein
MVLEASAAAVDAETNALIAGRDERIGALARNVADREDTISGLTQTITERDARIAQLEASAADHERQAVSARSTLEQARAALEARDADFRASVDALRAVYGSTSWKATAPLRRIALWTRRKRAFPPRIIRLKHIARGALTREPYEWAFVNGLFSRRARKALVRTYPHEHYKTVKGCDREKGYEYEARPLIHMNATSVSYRESLSECWQMLADDLLSPAYREAMSRLTGRDLLAAPMEAYVCHYGPGAWLGPHVDLKDKIVTHVFYFNDTWDKEDGGCLQILRSAEASDTVDEIMPIVGNSSILIRSESSWHTVAKVKNGCRSSRRSMNVIFYHRGAVSTMWPPGEQSPLHNYPQL